MDSYSPWVWLREMSFATSQEFIHNFIRRIRTINKEQILVRYSIVNESFSVILSFVQSYYLLDIPLLEYLAVFIGSQTWSLILISFLDRPHESSKFTWNNPINVSIFDSLIVLILFDIESLYVIPLMLDSEFKSLQTMKYSALIVAVTFWGIPERHNKMLVRLEFCECNFRV